MKELYQQLMDTIDRQEQMLRVKHFSNQDALELGTFLVQYAAQRGITVSVAVRRPAGGILFHHLMEGTNCNNQNWMRRKFNTVLLWEHSSLRAWAHQRLTGETIQTHGFTEQEYIFFGGGFPIFMESGELVGVLTISNLPHFRDHQFAVDGLAAWLGVDGVPVVSELPEE